MSKTTKKELQYQINGLAAEARIRHNSIMRIHRALASIGVDIFSDDFDLTEPKPQLKQLDQSVFDGLDEKWRFAAVDKCGEVWYSTHKTQPSVSGAHLSPEPNADSMQAKGYYDTSNWQNSLIERHTAKELTGSDLARAMLARGDRWILCGNTTDGFASPCIIDGYRCSEGDLGFVLTNGKSIEPRYIYPVNNQGEPLTAAEAGL